MHEATQMKPRGTLFLVPAPLDFGCTDSTSLDTSLPEQTQSQAAAISHWICESAKTTRNHLKRIGLSHPLCKTLQEMEIQELPREIHKKGDHARGFDATPLLKAALDGHNMGLMSEAGMPAVADPGSSVVRTAHALGIRVVPLVGPISLILALAASGLNGQNFAFAGYVPVHPTDRGKAIKALEQQARHSGQTQIVIETPYRNHALLQALLEHLHPDMRLSTSCGITLAHAHTISATVKQWKQNRWTLDNDTPCVFCFGL